MYIVRGHYVYKVWRPVIGELLCAPIGPVRTTVELESIIKRMPISEVCFLSKSTIVAHIYKHEQRMFPNKKIVHENYSCMQITLLATVSDILYTWNI